MTLDKFNNPPCAADFKLTSNGTDWQLLTAHGFFGDCGRCGLELEGFPIKYWKLTVRASGRRYFCLDCGDFLKEIDR